MFTGIIEAKAILTDKSTDSNTGNLRCTFQSSIAPEFKVDQSVSHNGVCLTVVQIDGDHYSVDIIPETLARSNLGSLTIRSEVNLERSMLINGRLDGHIVQGHVDTTGKVLRIEDNRYLIEIDHAFNELVVIKGSICINGVSLTLSVCEPGVVGVDLIPYTLEHTNIGTLSTGNLVNLEFDILGKYVQNMMKYRADK